jgi:fatty-acyl-CoA synthase
MNVSLPNPAKPRADRSASKAWASALDVTSRLMKDPAATFSMRVDGLGERFGDAPALIGLTEQLSHAGLAARVRQYARWVLEIGAGQGDVIGLLMSNRPEYMAAWLGISRTGALASLLNTELPPPALAHCMEASGVKWLIVDPRLADRARAACALMQAPPQIWSLGEAEGALRLDRALGAMSGEALPPVEGVSLSSPALHIFTSGTTGLPKAALVSHRRILNWAGWFAGMMGTGPEDRMYNCLPMFHSVGGVVATGSVLIHGGAVVVREKFSASSFWADVRAENCTLFQYIGELCRYLLAAPEREDDASHPLRMMVGNGLRPEVWSAFEARFQPPRILEFYAATEGTFSLYNAEAKPGSIGRFPPYLAHRAPAVLVKRDPETGEILRGPEGLALRCAAGEVGEAVGRVDPNLKFEGYTSAEESHKKLAAGLFTPDDLWFRTGDLMRQDAEGFFYFVDRTGDTFRWKGENVATTEVAAALTKQPAVTEALVFGVEAPGAEGRAGMAVMTVEAGFDAATLNAGLAALLPVYARPVFLRIVESLALTDTFKHRKADYQAEGYHPRTVTDPIYWREPKSGAYLPLTPDLYDRILSGQQPL